MCPSHNTLTPSTLQNRGVLALYVCNSGSFGLFYFISRPTRALERRQRFLGYKLSNYGLFPSHLPLNFGSFGGFLFGAVLFRSIFRDSNFQTTANS